nr:hypothetical protein [Lachnospiraceae bacterium]
EGLDYKLSVSKNKAVGEGKYKLTFLGNYKGHKAITGSFNILPTELSSENAELSSPDLIYKKAGKYFYISTNSLFMILY